jgi:hypothetical protein
VSDFSKNSLSPNFFTQKETAKAYSTATAGSAFSFRGHCGMFFGNVNRDGRRV